MSMVVMVRGKLMLSVIVDAPHCILMSCGGGKSSFATFRKNTFWEFETSCVGFLVGEAGKKCKEMSQSLEINILLVIDEIIFTFL